MQAKKATIIILDFLKARQVLENVRSLKDQETDFAFKIIVIDNSCNDNNADTLKGLQEMKDVSLYINEENLGYTKAHNMVKNELEGDYVFIVNPDIEWTQKDSLQKMVNKMETDTKIGVLGPRQINKDGSTAMTIRAFPKFYLQVARRTFLRKLSVFKDKVHFDEMRHLDYNKTQEVDWLQSSCVAVRKELWTDVGGFNEDYFLFMSDVEICFEAWRRGYKVVYYPEVRVGADGKRVSDGGFRQFFKSWVLRQHVRDSVKYRLKHFFDRNPRSEFKNN